MTKFAINPTRAENFPKWYQAVIKAADMAEPSSVRGCMVIKPWGYAIWEHIQQELDAIFKQQGHQNAYFPLLIPLKNLAREAEHIDGFAKECAVVTHNKLVTDADGKLQPDGELAEPFVIRPTSETIIGECFARWIDSYRDLPLKINQWANVMRWEMRTRMFLRTSEFLWQEGHTAHANAEEARAMTWQMIKTYEKFCRDWLALPVIIGEKTKAERFPGATTTLCIEAMMHDKKALQAGTSHFLGQTFAKAENISFTSKQGTRELAWTTSWGVSTRLIGALIMAHSDDNGLVLPPTIAPQQVVIMPIIRKNQDTKTIINACDKIAGLLRDCIWRGRNIRVLVDDKSGRHWYWLKKGVPLRIELGPRDLAQESLAIALRDSKQNVKLSEITDMVPKLLTELQDQIYNQALSYQQSNIFDLDAWDLALIANPGFYRCYAVDGQELEQAIATTDLTARCIVPAESPGTCIFTGKSTRTQVILAKAY